MPADQSTPTAGLLEDISIYDLPTPEPVELSDVQAVVITEGSRANIRSGPSLDAPIVAKALPGDNFQVLGKSDDGEWWQICCVPQSGSDAGEATEPAWVAQSVIRLQGDDGEVSTAGAVLPSDLTAEWAVDWQCSGRCEVTQCVARVKANASEVSEDGWLTVQYEVGSDEECIPSDAWSFEVNQFTGQERSGVFADNFLSDYWPGPQDAEPTHVFTLGDGRKVAVVCSEPQQVETQEEGGYVAAYEGKACHEVKSGMLVLLAYTKRWLFSGEHNGEKYDRAYFGDYEALEQRLDSTNADMLVVK